MNLNSLRKAWFNKGAGRATGKLTQYHKGERFQMSIENEIRKFIEENFILEEKITSGMKILY